MQAAQWQNINCLLKFKIGSNLFFQNNLMKKLEHYKIIILWAFLCLKSLSWLLVMFNNFWLYFKDMDLNHILFPFISLQDLFQNRYISIYLDNERILKIKKKILAPGEMELVKLSKEQLLKNVSYKIITIRIEEWWQWL